MRTPQQFELMIIILATKSLCSLNIPSAAK